MIDNICMNCSSEVHSRYCPDCGQKSPTSRITLAHFVRHDLMHGLWHIDKGILFTLREALLRPGQAALDYIRGRRIRYYNVFYLSLMIIGLVLVLKHFFATFDTSATDDELETFVFFRENMKVLLLCTVPLLAVNAWLIFRRMKLNIAEHFIMGGFTLVGMLFFILLYTTVDSLPDGWLNLFTGILELIFFALFIFFPCWAYSNLCRKRYTIFGLLWRIIIFQVLLLTEFMIILMLIFYFITGDTDLHISL